MDVKLRRQASGLLAQHRLSCMSAIVAIPALHLNFACHGYHVTANKLLGFIFFACPLLACFRHGPCLLHQLISTSWNLDESKKSSHALFTSLWLLYATCKWTIKKKKNLSFYWYNNLQVLQTFWFKAPLTWYPDKQTDSMPACLGLIRVTRRPTNASLWLCPAWSNQYPHLSQVQAIYRRQVGWQINSP